MHITTYMLFYLYDLYVLNTSSHHQLGINLPISKTRFAELNSFIFLM